MTRNMNKKKDPKPLVQESYKMYKKKDIEEEEAEEEEEIIKEAEEGRMKVSQDICLEIIMIIRKNRLMNLHGSINTKIL